MQTNTDGVFAGGDVVVFPFPPRNNKKVNIPHWQMAHVHGEGIAAQTVLTWDCVYHVEAIREKKQCVSYLIDRKGGSSRHDGQSHGFQNCTLLLVSHVWEDHTLCR